MTAKDSLFSFVGEQQLYAELYTNNGHFVAANNNDDDDKKILEQKLKEKMEEISKILEEHSADLKKSSSKYDDLRDQYQIKEQEISELRLKNSQLEIQKERAESMNTEIANYKKRIQILEESKKMYVNDNRTLREEALNAKSQSTIEMKKMRKEIEGLKIENEALEIRNESEKVNQTKKQLDEQQSRFQAEIESLKRQNEREVEERKASETELMQVRTECHMFKEILRKHNKEMEEMQAQEEEYKEAVQHLKLAKDEAVKLMKTCHLEFSASIKKFEESQQKLESLDLQLDNKECSETMNDSITNQSMSSPQLSPVRPPYAVTSPESSPGVPVTRQGTKRHGIDETKETKRPRTYGDTEEDIINKSLSCVNSSQANDKVNSKTGKNISTSTVENDPPRRTTRKPKKCNIND